MTARELIYRLKGFPPDAQVCVRGRNMHDHQPAEAVALVLEKREAEEGERARKAVVRIVGKQG